MIKLKEILTEAQASKELWYHVNNNISLEECVFRYGSKKYFLLITCIIIGIILIIFPLLISYYAQKKNKK